MTLLNALLFFFFFNDTATTEIYTLSLHDALPISKQTTPRPAVAIAIPPRTSNTSPTWSTFANARRCTSVTPPSAASTISFTKRSEEHTSELQSPCNLVCRLLLEKKKKKHNNTQDSIFKFLAKHIFDRNIRKK